MNSINPKGAYVDPMKTAVPEKRENSGKLRLGPEERARQVSLRREDVVALHRALVTGEHPVATRRDLTELHKRQVEMFKTLDAGLSAQASEKAAADRKHLVARLDEMRDAVNDMEGLLRIEVLPQFRMLLLDAFEDHMQSRGRRWKALVAGTALLGVGLAVGALFASEIKELGNALYGWILDRG